MVVIGLCGSSGSGKGYVCERLGSYGIAFIDTDKVYREILESSISCKNELVGFFGSDILDSEGRVVRSQLAKSVFEGENHEKRLDMLNTITHKYIKEKTKELIEKYKQEGYSGAFIDAPVLFESEFDKLCNVTACVTAPYEIKIKRIMARDSISYEKAEARLKSQLPDEKLRQLCDYEIDNSGTLDIDEQIKSILKDAGIELKQGN
ncbi:MAG: dephospho-CoA kinase [Clostridia bacterium]|nr:dephospho-CoA kinase [Clostridia bacterium]